MASSEDENYSVAASDEESMDGGEKAAGGGKRKKSNQSSQQKKPRNCVTINHKVDKMDAYKADSTDQGGKDFGISVVDWEKKNGVTEGRLGDWIRDEKFLRWAQSDGHGDKANVRGLRTKYAAAVGEDEEAKKSSTINVKVSKMDAYKADSTGVSMSAWSKKNGVSKGCLGEWIRDEKFLRWAHGEGYGDKSNTQLPKGLRGRYDAAVGRKKADAGGTEEGEGGVQGSVAKSDASFGGGSANSGKSNDADDADDESVVPPKRTARGRASEGEDGREERPASEGKGLLGEKRLRAIAMEGAKATEAMRYDLAFIRAETCLKEDPDFPMALDLRAHASFNLGMYKEAMADYEKLLRLVGANSKVSASLERCKSLLEQRNRVFPPTGHAPRSISPTNADAPLLLDNAAEEQAAKAGEDAGKPKAAEELTGKAGEDAGKPKAAEELTGEGGREGGQMEGADDTNETRIESLENDNAELWDRVKSLESVVYGYFGTGI